MYCTLIFDTMTTSLNQEIFDHLRCPTLPFDIYSKS